MELNHIKLRNIRSYKEQEITFPRGSTLLSGDIGSGKTSILLAIEFALFGLQPGQRGSSLLRNGEREGGIVMDFEVDGKAITLERTLKRGKTITQDSCSLTIDGKRKELSVTELKNKILELLNYPPEFSKKQNILYKFTVYTPQEEMKQIILQDAETRLNTLRYVFGIDKYKRVLENISMVFIKIREDRRMKEGMIANLEKDQEEAKIKEAELETKYSNLESVERELFLRGEESKRIQEEQEEISKKREEKLRFNQEIEKTKIMIANKREIVFSNSKRKEQLENQIKELESIKFDESELYQLEQAAARLNKEKQQFDEENLEISSKINSLNVKNQENEILKTKLGRIEICPTCLQDVDPVYKANVINQLESNTSQNVSNINFLILKKRELSEKLSKTDFEILSFQKQIQDLKILKIRFQEIFEKKKQLKEIEGLGSSLEGDIGILTSHLEGLQKLVFDLGKFDTAFELKKEELEEARKQERLAEIKVAELKKEIDVFSNQINELKERIQNGERIKKESGYLINLEDWISQKFVAVISAVERNILVKLKSEFSQLFAKWFGMLVSDLFNVQVDDGFTPIIEQQDYEIDYAYLSGGERTAVALAYRLALNQVINSLRSNIKTRNLVILDEPTDGFSEQQLDKMRDVLQELDVAQLIIVSHESKMESFVENVIRFRKQNGISERE